MLIATPGWDAFRSAAMVRPPVLVYFDAYTNRQLRDVLTRERPKDADATLYRDFLGAVLPTFFATCKSLHELRALLAPLWRRYVAPWEEARDGRDLAAARRGLSAAAAGGSGSGSGSGGGAEGAQADDDVVVLPEARTLWARLASGADGGERRGGGGGEGGGGGARRPAAASKKDRPRPPRRARGPSIVRVPRAAARGVARPRGRVGRGRARFRHSASHEVHARLRAPRDDEPRSRGQASVRAHDRGRPRRHGRGRAALGEAEARRAVRGQAERSRGDGGARRSGHVQVRPSFFTHPSVSRFDRVPFRLTGEDIPTAPSSASSGCSRIFAS